MSRGFFVVAWLLCLIGWVVSLAIQHGSALLFFSVAVWFPWFGIMFSDSRKK